MVEAFVAPALRGADEDVVEQLDRLIALASTTATSHNVRRILHLDRIGARDVAH